MIWLVETRQGRLVNITFSLIEDLEYLYSGMYFHYPIFRLFRLCPRPMILPFTNLSVNEHKGEAGFSTSHLAN